MGKQAGFNLKKGPCYDVESVTVKKYQPERLRL